MTAITQPRRRNQRPDFSGPLPFSVPDVIFVEPSDKCNLACRFCPTSDHDLMRATPGRNHGPMDFALFKKIINDICEFEKPIKVLRLYKDGEPLANPRLAEMIRYAKERRCSHVVDTTTNAVLLTREKADAILAAGLDRINISIYGMTSDQYVEFSGRRVKFDELLSSIRYLYEQSGTQLTINVKINGDVVPGETAQEFYGTFKEICHEINIESVMSCWSDYDYEKHGVTVNSEKGVYGQAVEEERLVCSYVFYSFSINSDGTASTCFLDWNRKRLIGDAKTQHVVDIWRGAAMRAHQEMMLRGERKQSPHCANCGQMTHGASDNIDELREVKLADFLSRK